VSWLPYGGDLVIAASLLGVVGSAIWIKGGIFRPDLMEEVRLYLGRNPFQVKAAILQRWEDVVAFTWLSLSFLLSLLGAVQSGRDQSRELYWAQLDTRILFPTLLAVGTALFLASVWISKWLGMRQAVPVLVNLQHELLSGALHVIRHDGLTDQLIPGAVVGPEQKTKQLAEAARRLDQVGRLVEILRRAEEGDASYGERLEAFARKFPTTTVED
jgi:hypothetical protein